MIIIGQGVFMAPEQTQGIIVTEEGVHNLGVFVSAPHPLNGNLYYASCIKEADAGRQHLVIHRLKMGATKFEEVHRFLGGGVPGAYAKGQITPGNCQIRQDGALVVSFSACPMNSKDNEWKSCTEILPNVDAAWQFLGAAVQIPNLVPGLDQVARDAASRAAEQAKLANSQSSQNASAIGKLDQAFAGLSAKVQSLPTMDQVWQKAIDATGRSEFTVQIKALALSVLIDAINFARTGTATSSRLRSLIEFIIHEKK